MSKQVIELVKQPETDVYAYREAIKTLRTNISSAK